VALAFASRGNYTRARRYVRAERSEALVQVQRQTVLVIREFVPLDQVVECYADRMRPSQVRTWRELFWEMFGRGGLFSLRPLPTTDAERQLIDHPEAIQPKDLTRLNLDSGAPRRD
jgi:hypothetical protein